MSGTHSRALGGWPLSSREKRKRLLSGAPGAEAVSGTRNRSQDGGLSPSNHAVKSVQPSGRSLPGSELSLTARELLVSCPSQGRRAGSEPGAAGKPCPSMHSRARHLGLADPFIRQTPRGLCTQRSALGAAGPRNPSLRLGSSSLHHSCKKGVSC